jgi:hypothetical protein
MSRGRIGLAGAGACLAVALAGPAVAGAGVVETERASGDFAAATVVGTVENPSAIRIRVRTSPRQRVEVTWSMTCLRGSGVGSKSGSFRGRSTITRRLRKPMGNADSCSVAATAQLADSGRLTVQILDQRT